MILAKIEIKYWLKLIEKTMTCLRGGQNNDRDDGGGVSGGRFRPTSWLISPKFYDIITLTERMIFKIVKVRPKYKWIC